MHLACSWEYSTRLFWNLTKTVDICDRVLHFLPRYDDTIRITVVVFPPFSISAGSGKLYLNSCGNAGKMREKIFLICVTKQRKILVFLSDFQELVITFCEPFSTRKMQKNLGEIGFFFQKSPISKSDFESDFESDF